MSLYVSCYFVLAHRNSSVQSPGCRTQKDITIIRFYGTKRKFSPLSLQKKKCAKKIWSKSCWLSDDNRFCKPALTEKAAAGTRPREGLRYLIPILCTVTDLTITFLDGIYGWFGHYLILGETRWFKSLSCYLRLSANSGSTNIMNFMAFDG